MANILVEFNDSQLGVVLGSVLHTLGAIAFLGGLVGYLAWHRHLAAHGHHHRKVLDAAAFLTYLAIVVNLLGGFMRTFQSGHPHLTEFADSAWVRAIAIKHLFLFAAMGAAIYLFERVAPRLVKAHKAQALREASPTGHRVGVLLVVLGILVASVLGALTQVVPLVSADGGMDGGHDHDAAAVYHNATGQLTSTPLQPGQSTGSFQVPDRAVLAEASLTWAPAQYQLRLTLTDPAGRQVAAQVGNGAAMAEAHAPAVGTWTYAIASDLAVNAAWTLSVRIDVVDDEGPFFAGMRTIPPGSFFEINTDMEGGSSLHWAWATAAPVHFDVHTHFDGDVQYLVNEDADQGHGEATATRAGGYSLLWENRGTQPVRLDYAAWGDFTLESVVPA